MSPEWGMNPSCGIRRAAKLGNRRATMNGAMNPLASVIVNACRKSASNCHMCGGILGCLGLLAVFAAAAAPGASTPTLTLAVANESAPAGTWTQIKVFLSAPRQVTGGGFSMDFDPSVFGDVSSVALFSATGDAAGYAHVNGKHIDAHFLSPSGGIGQLPGLPVLVVSIPVLPGLQAGMKAAVTVDASASAWTDTVGNTYSVGANPGVFHVGGSMSIESVSPAGGWQAAGTIIRIRGVGFDPSTVVSLIGASVGRPQLVSSQEIDATLDGATEITNKRLRLGNAGGDQVEYFPAMSSNPSDSPSTTQPLLPIATYKTVQWNYVPETRLVQRIALQNPTIGPITVTFFGLRSGKDGPVLTVPAGETYFPDLGSIEQSIWGSGYHEYDLGMAASSPIRALSYSDEIFNGPSCPCESVATPTLFDAAALAQQGSPSSVAWDWQLNTPAPADAVIYVSGNCPFAVSVPDSARLWLNAASTQGTVPANIRLTANPSPLPAGTYTAAVSVQFALPPVLSDVPAPVFTIPVTLRVGAAPFISVEGPDLTFSAVTGGDAPGAQVITVKSSGASVQFTATANTTSGGNWLSMTPAAGATPGSVTVQASRAGLASGSYSGHPTIQGPGNTVLVPVTLTIDPPTQPEALSFVQAAGTSASSGIEQTLIGQLGPISTFSVQPRSGGNWLSASIEGCAFCLRVRANLTGLAPGKYEGSISLVSGGVTTQVPVTLTVLGPPAASLVVTPSVLSLKGAAGQSATQSLTVMSSGDHAIFAASAHIPGATSTVTLVSSGIPSTGAGPTAVTPANLQVVASAQTPGTYYGGITVTWDGGAITVPLVLSVTAIPGAPPLMATVTNAASQTAGCIAPGELITVFGAGIGGTPSLWTLDSAGRMPNVVGGSQVVINGVPSPMIYASANQINAIVPYEAGTRDLASVHVTVNGQESAPWAVPLAPSAPGIFTIESDGVGQAAVLNQDSSVNGASNPAVRGTIIQIFATGEGQDSPGNVTGEITPLGGNTTVLPVTVTVGGLGAQVIYHGSAPGEVAGVLQVNAVVPQATEPGPAVPIMVKVGHKLSPVGAMIAVQ